LSDIEPKFTCTRCGRKGAEIRPMFGPAKMGTGIQTKTPGYRPGGSEVKFGNCNAVIQPFGKSTVCSLLNIRQIDPQL
jgi:hypothetical protein